MTDRSRKLVIIFAALYFVQGTVEPTAGLLSQPIRSLLRSWGEDSAGVASFMFWLGLPWYVKPVFGLMIDFLPIRGYRRRAYLILASVLTIVGMVGAGVLPLAEGARLPLLLMLLLPSIGIAFADVATDAHMIETGQPLGLTGRLQSAQWGALYAAGLLLGVVGGYISQHGFFRQGIALCALFGVGTLYIALRHIEERRDLTLGKGRARRALRELGAAVRTRTVVLIAIFYFLVNFNPFSSDVLYFHMTEFLGLDEQFVGLTYSLNSIASLVACILYGLFAKHLSLRVLLHGSVGFMVLASLVYIGLDGRWSAVYISLAYGFIYGITNLTQLELAGRFCPPAAAGTVFAILMALSNFAISSSSIVGGRIYEHWKVAHGAQNAYTILVLVGAGFTALCWLLVPLFPASREVVEPGTS